MRKICFEGKSGKGNKRKITLEIELDDALAGLPQTLVHDALVKGMGTITEYLKTKKIERVNKANACLVEVEFSEKLTN